MGKKNKHLAAEKRRQKEMERLKEAIAKQLAERASSREAEETQPEQQPESGLSFPSDPDTDEIDVLWEAFDKADTINQPQIFQQALQTGNMDSEAAFEMINEIHGSLDLRDARACEEFLHLVEELRQAEPKIYRDDIDTYNAMLLDVITSMQRWDLLPELLEPLSDKPKMEEMGIIADKLMYHGQVEALIPVLVKASSNFEDGPQGYFDWAIEEFSGETMRLILLHYLDMHPAPRADDPVLLEATASLGEWKEGWLEWMMPHLASSTPSEWQAADFSQAVDAETLEGNIVSLLSEFVAAQRRAGIPIYRADMAGLQITRALILQSSTSGISKNKSKARGKDKKKGLRSGGTNPVRSALVPTQAALDKTFSELIEFFSLKTYPVIATLEMLPDYLHFITRLGLIHPDEIDNALIDLSSLANLSLQSLSQYSVTPQAFDNLSAAWAPERLAELKNDPSLAEARSQPKIQAVTLEMPPARQLGERQVCGMKVTYLQDREIWRVIEIADDQTLHDLHLTIQDAVDFDDDHLYSFFMSNRAWDESSAYVSPREPEGIKANRVEIRDLNLRLKQRFLYLFDYGDEHRFDVQLIERRPYQAGVRYPRIVESQGENPPQYGTWEDEESWEDEGEDDGG